MEEQRNILQSIEIDVLSFQSSLISCSTEWKVLMGLKRIPKMFKEIFTILFPFNEPPKNHLAEKCGNCMKNYFRVELFSSKIAAKNSKQKEYLSQVFVSILLPDICLRHNLKL